MRRSRSARMLKTLAYGIPVFMLACSVFSNLGDENRETVPSATSTSDLAGG